MAVFTDSGGFIIPRSALQVDPAVKKLSMKRQNGHFWLPLARRVETSVNSVMVAPMDAPEATGRQMRIWTRSCPWKSGVLEWCGSLANPRQRSGQLTRQHTCRYRHWVYPLCLVGERPTQPHRLTEMSGRRAAWCRSITSLPRTR